MEKDTSCGARVGVGGSVHSQARARLSANSAWLRVASPTRDLPGYRVTRFAWEQFVLGTQQEARKGARDPWQCVGGRDSYQFTFEPLAGTPNIRVSKQISVGRTVMNGVTVWHVRTRGLALTG